MVSPIFSLIVPNNLAAQVILNCSLEENLEPLLFSNLFTTTGPTAPPLEGLFNLHPIFAINNYYYMSHSSRGPLELLQIKRTF